MGRYTETNIQAHVRLNKLTRLKESHARTHAHSPLHTAERGSLLGELLGSAKLLCLDYRRLQFGAGEGLVQRQHRHLLRGATWHAAMIYMATTPSHNPAQFNTTQHNATRRDATKTVEANPIDMCENRDAKRG